MPREKSWGWKKTSEERDGRLKWTEQKQSRAYGSELINVYKETRGMSTKLFK